MLTLTRSLQDVQKVDWEVPEYRAHENCEFSKILLSDEYRD